MDGTIFRAMIVEETEQGIFRLPIKQRSVDELPEGDVLIRVVYSSLNYKDALSASGNRGVTKRYPHTPGIDSVHCSRDIRLNLWKRLAGGWKMKQFDSLCREITLDEFDNAIELILKGQITGRTVINLEE